MPGRSSIDQLSSAVAAAVEAPAVKTSTSEPSSLSQTIAMRAVDAFAETLVIAALLGELGLVLGNVFARAYLHHSFLWADEVARLSLSILAFIGGAVAYRRRDHAFVRVVLNLVPRPVERACLAPPIAPLAVISISVLPNNQNMAQSRPRLQPTSPTSKGKTSATGAISIRFEASKLIISQPKNTSATIHSTYSFSSPADSLGKFIST